MVGGMFRSPGRLLVFTAVAKAMTRISAAERAAA